MDEFQSEKEQIDELKKWWKENGNFVITGLALGVLVLGGLGYWKNYKITQAESASAIYEQLIQAVSTGNSDAARNFAGQLDQQYHGTPYAAQAGLALARLYVNDNEPAQAANALQSVIDNAADEHVVRIARLRLAKVQLMQDQPDAAIATLAAGDPGEFAPLYHEARGDAYAEKGEPGNAEREYQAALDSATPGLLDRQFVEMKLNALGTAEPDA
ncbi:MAG: tetratricopeptide repeat protein [Gammaproteobacteria bacterium]|nr:tetratricopeptide repeat protein [Gammaproteobacteria bacterium]NND60169.1 tetratricopeptide repeat protein [Gammaproteobacteria bacterium]